MLIYGTSVIILLYEPSVSLLLYGPSDILLIMALLLLYFFPAFCSALSMSQGVKVALSLSRGVEVVVQLEPGSPHSEG